MAQEFSRRRFPKGAMAAALIPLVNLDTRRALAADRVPENDPMAQALKYVGASPRKARCGNCALYQKAAEADGHAACGIFQNRLVKGTGWCSAWVKGAWPRPLPRKRARRVFFAWKKFNRDGRHQ